MRGILISPYHFDANPHYHNSLNTDKLTFCGHSFGLDARDYMVSLRTSLEKEILRKLSVQPRTSAICLYENKLKFDFQQ